jgi:hypothetical protein
MDMELSPKTADKRELAASPLLAKKKNRPSPL